MKDDYRSQISFNSPATTLDLILRALGTGQFHMSDVFSY